MTEEKVMKLRDMMLKTIISCTKNDIEKDRDLYFYSGVTYAMTEAIKYLDDLRASDEV